MPITLNVELARYLACALQDRQKSIPKAVFCGWMTEMYLHSMVWAPD